MIRIALTLFFALSVLCLPARADTTDWSEVHGGAVRLISAGPLDHDHYLAGLEFLLEPGWHTYWRYPGESGIPPQITITQSSNLKTFEVLYPAPVRYADGYSNSIVYHDGIVLPIRVVPEDPAQDVQVSLEVLFGVCKDICVPGDAVLSLDFAPSAKIDKLSSKLIKRDLDSVPQQATDQAPRIVSVTASGDRLVIVAEVENAPQPDLFAEGPEGSYIGLPKLAAQEDGTATWHLSTKGLAEPQGDQKLRLVLTTDRSPVEHLEPIDPAWLR